MKLPDVVNGPGFSGDGEVFFKPFHTSKRSTEPAWASPFAGLSSNPKRKNIGRANPSGGAPFLVSLPLTHKTTNSKEQVYGSDLHSQGNRLRWTSWQD
jgi:hypothetical protein